MEKLTYTPVGWKQKPDTTTPVNSTNLNNMDDGIKQAIARINEIISNIENNKLEDITSSFIILRSGCKLENSHVYKQGNHIFGLINVYVPSVVANSVVTIGTLMYSSAHMINTGAFVGGPFSVNGICYLYGSDNLAFQTTQSGNLYVKAHIDYIKL